MSIRINCVNKADGYHDDPHESISWLGWTGDGTGKSGKMSREAMHDWVGQGGVAYVQALQNRANLEARVSRFGTKYVRTIPDGTTSDNLLRLMECR